MKVKYYDLENKRVFITGGGSGIGASIVEHFCEQKAEVYFIDRYDDNLKVNLFLKNFSLYNSFQSCFSASIWAAPLNGLKDE